MQMIGWFNKNFVHTGIFPSHFGRMVKRAFETRTGSDYKINEVPTAADLEIKFADMKIFISTINPETSGRSQPGLNLNFYAPPI